MKVTTTTTVDMLVPVDPRSGTLPSHLLIDGVAWRVSSCGFSHDTGEFTARCYRTDNSDLWRSFRFTL